MKAKTKFFWIITVVCSLYVGYQLHSPKMAYNAHAVTAVNDIYVSPLKFPPVFEEIALVSDIALITSYVANQTEKYCLAEAIYYESRGESLAGQLAVGLVVMNRVFRKDFPNTICNVVHEAQLARNGLPIKNKCQFSYYCDGLSDIPADQKSWNTALILAQYILDGKIFDFTAGATHYHAHYVHPNWEYPKVAQIDNHIFYKRK